jgi:hypothetical protein
MTKVLIGYSGCVGSTFTLLHVRCTPHFSWQDEGGFDPYKMLEKYEWASRVDRMLRDVGRYRTTVLDAKYVDCCLSLKRFCKRMKGTMVVPFFLKSTLNCLAAIQDWAGKIVNMYDVLENSN